jgi:Pyruvate/2-oxoacid:ferredoxin oxidoreductase delta subunit
MCEFCLKHGEGEKWYLQAKNYSEDMLSDLRRRDFIAHFADQQMLDREVAEGFRGIDRLQQLPWFIRNLFIRGFTRKMKKMHFGQVVPIEEIAQIFEFVTSIVRVACICRQNTLGEEKRYCYGISMGPNGGRLFDIFRDLDASYGNGPDGEKYETLSKEEALAAFRAHEREGLCHTVWTFHTPFIGGICNCDRSDCLALRTTVTHGIPILFRAEYVAEIDAELCNGCRQCMKLCQFGALSYSAANGKSVVDQKWCYGCGICRSACTSKAISLKDRAASPVAANLW